MLLAQLSREPRGPLALSVLRALGPTGSALAIPELRTLVRETASSPLRAASLSSLGALIGKDALPAARRALARERSEHAQTVWAAGSLLARYGDVSDAGVLLALGGADTPPHPRHAALHKAAELVLRQPEDKQRVLIERLQPFLSALLEDRSQRSRETGLSLLTQVGTMSSVAALNRFLAQETIPALRERCRDAIRAVSARGTGPLPRPAESLARLQHLEDMNTALEERIAALETRWPSWERVEAPNEPGPSEGDE